LFNPRELLRGRWDGTIGGIGLIDDAEIVIENSDPSLYKREHKETTLDISLRITGKA